jgi:hypothetical protein
MRSMRTIIFVTAGAALLGGAWACMDRFPTGAPVDILDDAPLRDTSAMAPPPTRVTP